MQTNRIPVTSGFLDNPRIRRYILSGNIILSSQNEADVMQFKKILQYSMSQGRWNGTFPRVS